MFDDLWQRVYMHARVGAVAAGLAMGGLPAQADTIALLIGASDYDGEIGLADLKGPANDVRLLRDVLQARGVSDITLLADGVEQGGNPTRQAILDAFGDLARRAAPGDLVYIHMSGHGTRQPDGDNDETDGLDEVFLPTDTRRAEPGSNLIVNAIIDDEIGAAVHAIRETGADVWLVLDSCHSGSGLRAADTVTAARFVDPALLGVDIGARRQGEAEIIETAGAEPAGGFLAFYAARSSEVAREVDFAAGTGEEHWYGLFSAKLAARLEQASNLSYRQLFQAVLSDMNDATVPGGARMQTPLWEGSMIDAAVLGGRATSGLRRFAVAGDELAAGLVQGLGEGTLLGLVADAADAPDALIGHAQVEGARATRAWLRPVDAACIPRSDAPCPVSGTLPAQARFAQVIARPVDLVLRLAPPRDLAGGAQLADDSAPVQALAAAIAMLQGDAGIVLDDTAYTVETVWAEDRLWFGPRASIGERPVGLAVPAEPDALATALARIKRAEDMAALLSSVATNGSLLNPNPVRVSADLFSADVADLQPPGTTMSPRRECDMASAATADLLSPAADLKQCDRLQFGVQGLVAGARDVNRVHIDAQFCIHAEHEHIEDTAAPRQLGAAMTLCSDCPDGYSAGIERLFIVVTQAQPNAEPLNLRGLVENCAAAPAATRGRAEGDLTGFLAGLARRPGTRGSMGAVGISDVWVERFDWRVLPRSEAFLKAGRDPAGN